jgi:hypothetical protein
MGMIFDNTDIQYYYSEFGMFGTWYYNGYYAEITFTSIDKYQTTYTSSFNPMAVGQYYYPSLYYANMNYSDFYMYTAAPVYFYLLNAYTYYMQAPGSYALPDGYSYYYYTNLYFFYLDYKSEQVTKWDYSGVYYYFTQDVSMDYGS